MILMADSGSTKTSWCITDKENTLQYFYTEGINPFFRTSENIEAELKNKLVSEIKHKIDKIFFYGAGIINKQKGDIVENALQNLFPKAEIEIENDLLAAARSTLGIQQGIACILGTGSNSCMYNGVEITENVKPLGFILGDEGSGAVIGKKLLADILKGIAPQKIISKFQSQFKLPYSDLMERVYKHDYPNRFLAGLVPFVAENISEKYCAKLVEDSFEEFLKRNIYQYPGYNEQPVSFVGSVAFHFQEQLRTVFDRNDVKLKNIMKEPMPGLLNFHSKSLK